MNNMTPNNVADKLSFMKNGETFTYHTGFIVLDRLVSKEVRELQCFMLQIGTDKNSPIYKSVYTLTKNTLMGRGIVRLTQSRIENGKYEYMATKV